VLPAIAKLKGTYPDLSDDRAEEMIVMMTSQALQTAKTAGE